MAPHSDRLPRAAFPKTLPRHDRSFLRAKRHLACGKPVSQVLAETKALFLDSTSESRLSWNSQKGFFGTHLRSEVYRTAKDECSESNEPLRRKLGSVAAEIQQDLLAGPSIGRSSHRQEVFGTVDQYLKVVAPRHYNKAVAACSSSCTQIVVGHSLSSYLEPIACSTVSVQHTASLRKSLMNGELWSLVPTSLHTDFRESPSLHG